MKLSARVHSLRGSPRARLLVAFMTAALWFVAVSGVPWASFDEPDVLGPRTLVAWLTRGEVCDGIGCQTIEMQSTWLTFAVGLRWFAWFACAWSILVGAVRARRRPPAIMAWVTVMIGFAGMMAVFLAGSMVDPTHPHMGGWRFLTTLSWGSGAMFVAALVTGLLGLESTGRLDRWKRDSPPPPPRARVV